MIISEVREPENCNSYCGAAIWSDDPRNVFFKMNGHTYVGLEQWSQFWQYYGQHKEIGWWEPFEASKANTN